MSAATEEEVILVDIHDHPIGTAGKLRAHREGLLHRAISVFIFDDQGRMLLQRRALSKYHSGGLWSNACCSHPRPNETTTEAARRRLQEEMGFVCPLKPVFSFIYKVALDNDLTEHELDHILIGNWEGAPQPNPEEVSEWKWIPVSELQEDVLYSPESYTYWFRELLDRVVDIYH